MSKIYRRRLRRRNPEEAWDVGPRSTWALYIGKVINPKSNQKFKVFWDGTGWGGGSVYITKDEPGRLGPGSRLNKYAVGIGTLDFHELVSVIEEGYSCVRTHTADGVVEEGKGYGSALYAGMCLAAASLHFLLAKSSPMLDRREQRLLTALTRASTSPYEPCVYSIDSDDRSDSADKWWDRQSEEGLASRYDHCVVNTYSGKLPMTAEKIRKLDSRGFAQCATHGMNFDPNCSEMGCRYLRYTQSRNISLLSNTRYRICSKDTLQVIHIENLIRHGRIAEAPYLSLKLQEMINAYQRMRSQGLRIGGNRPNPDEEDYAGSHEAPGEEGAPLHNLLEGGTFPSDVYTHMRYYQFHDAALESQAERTIRHFRGKPDGKVRIYRAVPKHVIKINTGDWVTIVKDYAIEHSEGEDFKIISARVPARMVYTNGDSLMEWGYVGPRRVSREHLRPNPLRGDRLERWLERKVLARAATRAEVRKLIQILARSHQPEKIYNLFHLLPSEDYRWAAHQYWLARWGSRSYLEL